MAKGGNGTMQQHELGSEDPHAHERALIPKSNCCSTMQAATPIKASAISRFAISSTGKQGPTAIDGQRRDGFFSAQDASSGCTSWNASYAHLTPRPQAESRRRISMDRCGIPPSAPRRAECACEAGHGNDDCVYDDDDDQRGKGPAPRRHLAEQAYPSLQVAARLHRLFSYVFLALAVSATSFAVWEATKVALGKSLLASLQDLRTQQTALNDAKMRLETKSDSARNGMRRPFQITTATATRYEPARKPASGYYGLSKDQKAQLQEWAIQRQKVETAKSPTQNKPTSEPYRISCSKSPAEQDICDRDLNLASTFGLFYHGLQTYRTNWPSLVGRSFEVVESAADGTLYHYTVHSAVRVPSPAKNIRARGGKEALPPPTGDDYEWIVVARLLVMGNDVLPVVFSLLGAIAFVMVDYFAKVRGGLLAPRDLPLAWVRLVLGLLVGACIGLIYSSGVPVTQAPTSTPTVGALVSALSLSASGIAFLAGFGVDAVFSMLKSLIRRVFPTTS